MATKIKGICKGSFKYFSQIFVVKEREMEIGFPTDVKHVAHIGCDGPNGTAPSWMSEFKGSDLAVTSTGRSIGGSKNPTWSSQDFDKAVGRQLSSARSSNFPPSNLPSIPKKQKTRRKKVKSSASSPKSGSSRSSRSYKSKSMLAEAEEADSLHNSVNL